MPHPSHLPSYYHPNIWGKVQTEELLIMQLSPQHCTQNTLNVQTDLVNKNPELLFMTHDSTGVNILHQQMCGHKLPHNRNHSNSL